MKLCNSLQGVRVFHGVEQEICLVMCYLYWEVRLKPSNIALSLALHRLPEKRDVIVGFLYHVINFVWCRELAWSAMDQEMVLLESFYRQALRPWVQAVFYITLHSYWYELLIPSFWCYVLNFFHSLGWKNVKRQGLREVRWLVLGCRIPVVKDYASYDFTACFWNELAHAGVILFYVIYLCIRKNI